MIRGELVRLPAPREPHGHEQRGARYGVVVQADELLTLSTVLVAPTSTRARPAPWRPEISVDGTVTRILPEQTRVVDAARIAAGPPVGSIPTSSRRWTTRSASFWVSRRAARPARRARG